METVSLIVNILNGWRIFIKPHPATPKAGELKNIFETISSSITFTNPADSLEKYIEMSDAVAGLSPASSALLTAAWQCPNKPIFSLDLDKEVMGDGYKDFSEVEHVDSEEKLICILESIQCNKYQKKTQVKLEPGGFTGTIAVLNHLLEKHADNSKGVSGQFRY